MGECADWDAKGIGPRVRQAFRSLRTAGNTTMHSQMPEGHDRKERAEGSCRRRSSRPGDFYSDEWSVGRVRAGNGDREAQRQ